MITDFASPKAVMYSVIGGIRSCLANDNGVHVARVTRHCVPFTLIALLAGATAAEVRPTADPRIAEIVAAGKVRVGLFPSFFYAKDPTNGTLRGVGIEIASALAARIGVEAQLTEYSGPAGMVECLKAGTCDVAFLGISADRAVEVDFSPPYLKGDFTFLVPPGSPIRKIADADMPGTRIAVVRNHSMDIALRGKLKHAVAVHVDTPDAAFELLRTRQVTVLAGIRPGLMTYATQLAGSRVLEDRYGANVLAMAVRKGKAGWLGFVSEFVADSKASGLVQKAIVHTGMRGIQVVSLQNIQ